MQAVQLQQDRLGEHQEVTLFLLVLLLLVEAVEVRILLHLVLVLRTAVMEALVVVEVLVTHLSRLVQVVLETHLQQVHLREMMVQMHNTQHFLWAVAVAVRLQLEALYRQVGRVVQVVQGQPLQYQVHL